MTNTLKETDKPDLSVSSKWLTTFVDVYHELSTDNLHLLTEVYHKNVKFKDPMHELTGFDALYQYFVGLYQNVSYCQFEIQHVVETEQEAALYWTMTYQHKQLNAGKKIAVSGSSHLKQSEGKVIYHRDYIDLGQMLYQHIPVIGKVISWIKNRASR